VAPDPEDPLAQQLRQLRHEYLRDSGKRVEELRNLRIRIAQEGSAALPDLRQAFHRLAGSGGSYGFPDVSTRSRDAEHLVADMISTGRSPTAAELASLDKAVETVAAAFQDAMRSIGLG
jgi:chemotaxis protein histidine kinase CheA